MPAPRTDAPQDAPILFNSVNTVVARTSISRTKVFAALKSGELRSIFVNNRRLIPEDALQEWVAALAAASTKPTRTRDRNAAVAPLADQPNAP